MIKHVTVPLSETDVNDEDRAIVSDFFEDPCHAEECENNRMELEYIAARSRLNGAAVAFGLMGMAEAIRARSK